MQAISLPEFVDLPDGIDDDLLFRIFDERFRVDKAFSGIGDVHSNHKQNILSFLSDGSLVDHVNDNNAIKGVFCRSGDRDALRPDIAALVVSDPKFYFFTMMDFISRNHARSKKTEIGRECNISPRATISDHSVVIGNGVVIEPGVYIAPGTIIADEVLIRANATVGVDGFQHQHTIRGMVSPLHDGWLYIGPKSEVGYSASLSRGFSYRATVIGSGVKMDALSYVAHGTSIGDGSIICAQTAIMGHVSIGERSWIGPNSVISSRLTIGCNAKISLGSVVTTDVPAGARYSGNFAVPHDQFIADLKARAPRK